MKTEEEQQTLIPPQVKYLSRSNKIVFHTSPTAISKAIRFKSRWPLYPDVFAIGTGY